MSKRKDDYSTTEEHKDESSAASETNPVDTPPENPAAVDPIADTEPRLYSGGPRARLEGEGEAPYTDPQDLKPLPLVPPAGNVDGYSGHRPVIDDEPPHQQRPAAADDPLRQREELERERNKGQVPGVATTYPTQHTEI